MKERWRRHERWRAERILITAAMAIGTLLLGGVYLIELFAFAESIPAQVTDREARTDAIVVLTGGGMRVTAGFELLAEGRADRLFISGVNRQVEPGELKAQGPISDEKLACCVTLGYGAGDTIGNAVETAAWAAQHRIASIRLVTAAYHMPRSLLEMRRAMPAVTLVPHPVFPAGFQRDGWWRSSASAGLVLVEFNKLLGARLRHALGNLILGRSGP